MAKVTMDLAKFDGIAKAKAERGLKAALLQGEAILRGDLLSRPGTGRIYKRRGVTHQASAPGEPPAPDLGRLRGATQADPQLQDGSDGSLTGRIVANTEYASGLERGTEKVAARPYLSTLRDQHGDKLREAFVSGAKG